MNRASLPLLVTSALVGVLALPRTASAQPAPQPTSPTGAPADAKVLVTGPAAPADAPKLELKDGTTVTLSAGGLLTTGNSRLLAASANGGFETRKGNNGIAASLIANYGQGAPAGNAIQVTAENAQGRLRYDRYVSDRVSAFLMATGRHDRFQGLDFRLNIDPGVKYLFLQKASTALWGELGYDLQHDIRRNEARAVLDPAGVPTLDAAGQPIVLDKTYTDHSSRLYAGFRHAFNEQVTFQTGLEYLQSVKDSTRYRLNYDALFAAKVGAGLAVGFGFSVRYDHAPLPGKEKTDTSTTVSLIYAFNDAPDVKAAETCPCPDPTMAPPASSNPPPAADPQLYVPPPAAPAPPPAPAPAAPPAPPGT